MNIRIKETGEVKKLSLVDRETGIDGAEDIVKNYETLKYNDDDNAYEMPQDMYDWWKKWFANREQDEEDIESLAHELGISKYEIWRRVPNTEMSNEHDEIQATLQELREEYQKGADE